MHETPARRVVLAQAIEMADAQGKLVGQAERERIDQQARHTARAGGAGPVPPEHFLDLRAQRLLQVVGERNRAVAGLVANISWPAWLFFAAPAATLLLGALTERIADPHRVDLLSLPLLAIVFWNLLVYLVLVIGALLPGAPRERPALDALRRWADGLRGWRRKAGFLGAEVAAQFHLRWNAATASLQAQRWKALLHLAALGWAAGVAVSLLVQGLVVQYRVGWESTFLDAAQVHGILSVLLSPVMWLFPFPAFSVQEIERLHLGPGDIAQFDPRWVWMYAALLVVVVIVPRAVLAAAALGRAKVLARRVRLDLREPYFQRIISLLTPARIQLCVVTHRAGDREALLKVLAQEQGAGCELAASPAGDTLRLAELPGDRAPPVASSGRADEAGWMARLWRALSPARDAVRDGETTDPQLAAIREDSDVVLHAVGQPADIDAARPMLEWLAKPVLVLATGPDALPGPRLLPFGSFARCWVQEGALLDAIRDCLAEPKRAGFDRIAAAWHARNRQRFERSMAAVAEHLLVAARQAQEVPSGALSMTSLVRAQEREAQAQARQGAMAAVWHRLGESAARMSASLRSLHGLDQATADALDDRLQQQLVVHRAVDMPQAGLAGAATGAAMGASVDLLAGGLTLGAATALGALVGAGMATIGAAWKNRSTTAGATVVQLSDEMMQALVEAALLRYLAAAHEGRGLAVDAHGELPSWKAEVVAAVEAHKAWLVPFWAAARVQPDTVQATALSLEVETVATRILDALYPPRLR